MLISYPALFYYVPDEDYYYIYFPDIGGGGTQGYSIEEAMMMASDYLGLVVSDILESGEKVPKKSKLSELSLSLNNPFKDDKDFEFYYDKENSFASMVCVDLENYLGSNELVKKTLSIPKWSNDLGNRLNLNFSKVLTEAIEKIAIK